MNPAAAVDTPEPGCVLFLPCGGGIEPWLAEEAAALLPGRTVEAVRGGVVVFAPDLGDAMALNLGSRLAQRVLLEVAHGRYQHEDDLYRLARSVHWPAWIDARRTLRVDTTAQRSPLRSLHFASLRVKDAVCDSVRDASGERPSVDTRDPDLALVLHVGPEHATLYVDTSGEPLFKRGWREDKGDAPLKETLAAALLAAAGWRGTPEAGGALHDPCCGSGTIAIEAAQIACGIAPGLHRRFAFERLQPFGTPALRVRWQQLREAARAAIHAPTVPVHASDVSFRMVDFAKRNAQRAGVAKAIEFHGGDALERPAPALADGLPGTLLLNPPYGERIDVAGKAGRDRPGSGMAYGAAFDGDGVGDGDRERDGGPARRPQRRAADAGPDNREAPDDFFPRLATHWKRAYTRHPAGWTAWVLSPDAKLPGRMHLQASRRVPMWNGPIECRLFRFDLVAGTHRATRGEAPPSTPPEPAGD